MNKALLQQLMELSPAERIELAQDLWDSISPDAFPPLTPEQEAEIDRRLDAHEKDPNRAVPWSEVRARLRSRFK